MVLVIRSDEAMRIPGEVVEVVPDHLRLWNDEVRHIGRSQDTDPRLRAAAAKQIAVVLTVNRGVEQCDQKGVKAAGVLPDLRQPVKKLGSSDAVKREHLEGLLFNC